MKKLIRTRRPVQDEKPSKIFNAKHEAGGIKPGTLHGGEEIRPGTLHGGEEIRPGTLCVNDEYLNAGTLCASISPATYRTKDGSAYYKFQYIDIGGKFEIDILQQPSYEGQDDSAHTTHRLPSARRGQKICIASGSEPTSLDGAKSISMQWAELTHTYIKSGKGIDSQVAQNSGDSNGAVGFWDWLFS